MQTTVTDIASRLRQLITTKYGRAEEELMTSGLIDSLRAVELALALEKEFGLAADSFALSDMKTITSLSQRIFSAQGPHQK
ncbi:acyl carrier protein [Archangium sp.]|uniref:acyl carrier protein n=1 Tax=Archangium sp. TaxID=1872627 RepID=UPI002D2B2B2E|nr:acyl carrier protein [Archangium sp.]HYO55263.1 acyl carrier protein [Archangium sp.]